MGSDQQQNQERALPTCSACGAEGFRTIALANMTLCDGCADRWDSIAEQIRPHRRGWINRMLGVIGGAS